MSETGPFQGIPVPKGWPECVKLAVIHTVALAHRVTTFSRSLAINSSIERVRLAGERDGVQSENALLREELRIKDARMAKLPPRKRPQYSPQERMAILELKAARAWNLAETARVFMLESETVSSWMKRAADEQDGLIQLSRPVKELTAFRRVKLAKGESRKVKFKLSESDLIFLRKDMTWGTEPGAFEVYIGPNSRDCLKGNFTLAAD